MKNTKGQTGNPTKVWFVDSCPYQELYQGLSYLPAYECHSAFLKFGVFTCMITPNKCFWSAIFVPFLESLIFWSNHVILGVIEIIGFPLAEFVNHDHSVLLFQSYFLSILWFLNRWNIQKRMLVALCIRHMFAWRRNVFLLRLYRCARFV